MRAHRPARFLLLFALLARPASGQSSAELPSASDPIPDEAAKSKFTAAIKLYNAARADLALPLFREVVESTGSPNARLYVGLCLGKLGKTVLAYTELVRTAKDASLRSDKYDRTREAALAEVAVLDARVGKLVVTLPETPSGFAVAIDGRRLDEREVGAQVVLEPGAHRVEASAPGRSPATRDVHLEGGETRTMALAFGDAEALHGGAAQAGTPIERIVGYSTLGVGAAGFSLFVIAGLMARSKYSALEDACGDSRCVDPRREGDIESGKSLQTIANVGLAMGLVGAALGGTLLVLSPKNESARVAAEACPGGGYITYARHF